MNAPDSSPQPDVLTATGRWMVLVVCASSLFLVGLDTTIVNVALPAIGDGLSTDTRGLEWVADAYTVAFASLLISSGALADRFGRRRIFLVGLSSFAVASAICALAPGVGALIAARAAQGVGASMLSPVALAIVVTSMPDPRERARAIGVWASVFGLSMAAGPLLGGVLLSQFSWRSVFWINVPLVALAVGAVLVVVPESRGSSTRRLDLPGQALLAVLLALVVGVLIEGPHLGWGSPAVLAMYLGLGAFTAAFLVAETRHHAPLIDLGAFAHRAFTAAVLGAIAVFVAVSITLLFNTYYLQVTRGWTPLSTGLAVLPIAAGATAFAPLSGHLVGRTGPRLPLTLAGGFLAAGGALAWMATSGTGDWALGLLLAAYSLLGIGVGFANAPITNTAVSGLPAERTGVAAGITSTARQVGAAAGIAVAGGLVGPGLSGGSDIHPSDLATMGPGWAIVVVAGLGLLGLVTVTGRTAASLEPATTSRGA